jgi:hypothetical protein
VEFGGESRIDGGDLGAGVHHEVVRSAMVDHNLDNDLTVLDKSQRYTDDVAGAMRFCMQRKRDGHTTQDKKQLEIRHLRSPQPGRLREL